VTSGIPAQLLRFGSQVEQPLRLIGGDGAVEAAVDHE
jgi:hypothetical protein